MKRALISSIIIIAVILSSLSFVLPVSGSVSTSFTGVVENDRFILECEQATGNITLVDKLTQQNYEGIPSGAEDDPLAKGMEKQGLMSQLVIIGVNKLTNQLTDFASYPSSVKREQVKTEQFENGFRITYTFEKEEIVIPLYCTIDDDGFAAHIDASEIKEGEKIIIRDIEVLPYFGAGSSDDNGFIFVPDGSGAVIDFNNGKSGSGKYFANIYGRDESFYLKSKSIITADVKLPVIGLEKNGYGFVAVAGGSDAAGHITADTAGTRTSYNKVNFGFTLHSTDTVYINKDTWYEKGVLKYNTLPEIELIDIRYYFYTKENGGVSSMAQVYRNLIKTNSKIDTVPSGTGIHLDIISAIDVSRSVLGIPLNIILKTSTFDQTGEIISELQDNGVSNMSVRLLNTDFRTTKHRITTKYSPMARLGGKKGFKELTSDDNIRFYTDIDITKFDVGFLNFTALLNGVKSLSNEVSVKHSYDIATYHIRSDLRQFGLLIPQKFTGVIEKITDYLTSGSSSGISPGDLGSELYSDFNNNASPRQKTLEHVTEAYEETVGKISVSTGKANSYAIPYSELLIEIPHQSSGYSVFDHDVQFYAMTVGGLRDFTFAPMNLQADPDSMLLKCLMVGAKPSYTLFYKPSEIVKGTAYSHFFNCNYEVWLDSIKDSSIKIDEFNRVTDNSFVMDIDDISWQVKRVTYGNGAEVIFNFSDETVQVGEVSVSPVSYKVTGSGA